MRQALCLYPDACLNSVLVMSRVPYTTLKCPQSVQVQHIGVGCGGVHVTLCANTAVRLLPDGAKSNSCWLACVGGN